MVTRGLSVIMVILSYITRTVRALSATPGGRTIAAARGRAARTGADVRVSGATAPLSRKARRAPL